MLFYDDKELHTKVYAKVAELYMDYEKEKGEQDFSDVGEWEFEKSRGEFDKTTYAEEIGDLVEEFLFDVVKKEAKEEGVALEHFSDLEDYMDIEDWLDERDRVVGEISYLTIEELKEYGKYIAKTGK